jgi:hypothetical protein
VDEGVKRFRPGEELGNFFLAIYHSIFPYYAFPYPVSLLTEISVRIALRN